MFRIRKSTAVYIVGGIVIGAAIASLIILPAVLPGVLGAAGFTATGVQLGSAAAATHSAIGIVSAGSTFALAQSVAMGGAIPIAWSLGAAAVGGAVGGVLGGAAARLMPVMAPHIASAMRGVQMAESRAVEGVRRFASWVKRRM
ncbi:hypothetical protein FOMPIDRAFT_1024057 [Fomitopsis schrenkii]|uniref:Uncharacterized protein n=1 Tax=Fomitopsis schrenkii TaxID=2126942 RepID=S8FN75_FOMSC|nr:hypothetical protein FOMPIDRAFT_1024057 [Fomitopsis schrenkii]